jgi:hypothetical protein
MNFGLFGTIFSSLATRLMTLHHSTSGGLAQLAERVLSMHEVLGSIPKFSKYLLLE